MLRTPMFSERVLDSNDRVDQALPFSAFRRPQSIWRDLSASQSMRRMFLLSSRQASELGLSASPRLRPVLARTRLPVGVFNVKVDAPDP